MTRTPLVMSNRGLAGSIPARGALHETTGAVRRPAGHNLPVVKLVRVKLIGREHVTHEMVTFTVLSRRRYILYNDLRKWECRSSYFSWLTCTRPEEVRGQREGEIISCRSPKHYTAPPRQASCGLHAPPRMQNPLSHCCSFRSAPADTPRRRPPARSGQRTVANRSNSSCAS
jgi:hypothetical protein